MNLSNSGLAFLKKREDLKLKAYYDIGGVPTIGYGTILYLTGIQVKITDKIDQSTADANLQFECNRLGRVLDRLVTVHLNRNQADALISFVYNVGQTAFKTSTLRKLINSTTASDDELEIQWMRWDKYHKDGKLHASKGLRERRILEWNLWCGEL